MGRMSTSPEYLKYWLKKEFPGMQDPELGLSVPDVRYVPHMTNELSPGVVAGYDPNINEVLLREMIKGWSPTDVEKVMTHEGAVHPYQEYLRTETPRLWDLIMKTQPKGQLYSELQDYGGYRGPEELALEQWAWHRGGGPELFADEVGLTPMLKHPYGETKPLHWLWKEAIPLFEAAAREPRAFGE